MSTTLNEKPIVLKDVLDLRTDKEDSELPYLSDKFDIAKALSETLFKLHIMGRVRGNIRPQNILL